jgi:tetratricopeptide (TPR) repeat protein
LHLIHPQEQDQTRLAEAQVDRASNLPRSLEPVTAQTWLTKAQVDRAYAQDLGQRLFYTLFPGKIGVLFYEAKQRIASDERLRIVLNLPLPKALEDLPWELICDPTGEHGFLARSQSATLVRRYTNVALPNKPPQQGPLRILVVTASPKGTAPLSTEQETEEIVRGLEQGLGLNDTLRLVWQHLKEPATLPDLVRRLLQGRRFEVAPPLHHATLTKLQDRLREAERDRGFHVIHFIGHGEARPDGGVLFLEGEGDGKPDPVQADVFAEMVDYPTVNLVVLNACETASANNLFPSVALETVRKGVPAVIGMRVPVLDRAAVDFAREFYRTWAAGEPIELAMAYARRLIRQLSPGAAADWSIPVLYMGYTGQLTPRPLERAHRLPWQVRLLRWTFVTFLGLLAVLSTLLGIPETVQTVRTEVPIVRCVWPYPMDPDRFTVAYNRFTVVDSTGAPVWSDDGQRLADFLFKRFEISFDELNLRIPYELRPPSHTCAIQGRTREERAQSAAELADEINADIIIYGVITDTLRGGAPSAGVAVKPQVSLEFSVGSRGFAEGEEIAGPYALGGPIPIDLPFDADAWQGIDNPPHLVRTDILSEIALGLSYYAADNPTQALAYFQKAEQNAYWPRTDGKEIIYLLLGNAAIRQAALDPSPGILPTALGYYTEALSIDPGYVRAKLGEATALYMMALPELSQGSTATEDCQKLQEALDTYEEVRAMGGALGIENAEFKIDYGLANVYLAQSHYCSNGEAEKEDAEYSTAGNLFTKVTKEFEGGNERLVGRAGDSYGKLGLIAYEEEDVTSAIDYLQKAVKYALPSQQVSYYRVLGIIYCETGQRDLALNAYQGAINTARLYGYRQEVEEYTEQLHRLQREGCPPGSGDAWRGDHTRG